MEPWKVVWVILALFAFALLCKAYDWLTRKPTPEEIEKAAAPAIESWQGDFQSNGLGTIVYEEPPPLPAKRPKDGLPSWAKSWIFAAVYPKGAPAINGHKHLRPAKGNIIRDPRPKQ